mgnify:CR=1 FL=1|jgi:hypothetical protein
MSEHHRRFGHARAKTALVAIAVFLGSSILLLWSWNTLGADLFQLPEAHFKHAVAFGLLIMVASALHVVGARLAAGNSRRPGREREVVS